MCDHHSFETRSLRSLYSSRRIRSSTCAFRGPLSLLPSPLPPLLASFFRIGAEPRARIFGQCSDRCLGDDAFVYRPRHAARPLTLLPCKRHARRAQLYGGLARPFVHRHGRPRCRNFLLPAIFLLSRRFAFEGCTVEPIHISDTEAVSRQLENESDTLLCDTTRDLITARYKCFFDTFHTSVSPTRTRV